MDKNIFSEARFHNEDAARAWFETVALAERPHLPALQEREALRHQEDRPLSLWREGMPQGFHRHYRNRHGAQPRQADGMGGGFPSGGLKQEGLFAHQLHRSS